MEPLEVRARTQQMRRHEGDVDVCIIGCGAAGSVLAKELAEAGWRVVVLEAGPWLDTEEDLRQDEVEMRGKFDWDDRRWVDGNEPFEQGHVRDGRGVGGGTLHFGGVALRFWPEDFERRTRDGIGRDWPIRYTDLEPYYDRVEEELQLSGPLSLPWGPRRGKYPQGAHPFSAADHLIAAGMYEHGIESTAMPLAILQGQHEGRSPCMNYGYCRWGCKSRAKASMHVTYVPKAVLAGAEIRDRARVTQLEADDAGRITGIVYQRDGVEHRQSASVVILSAFCIENPRLLLHSATPAFPDGLANSSGMVGRGLMTHVADAFVARFEQPVHMWSTTPSTLLSQHHYGSRAGMDYAGGWSWESSLLFPGEFASLLASTDQGMWGQRLADLLAEYPSFAILTEEGEFMWHEDNRVELSDEVDEFGVPRPRITLNARENEQAMREDIRRTAGEILATAGAQEVFLSRNSDHTMGGCVIGADPQTSVVDANLRTHDHPNLYICDSSVFASSAGAQPLGAVRREYFAGTQRAGRTPRRGHQLQVARSRGQCKAGALRGSLGRVQCRVAVGEQRDGCEQGAAGGSWLARARARRHDTPDQRPRRSGCYSPRE